MATQSKKLSVGIRELHSRTSELIKAVESGAELEVTNHGRPVARVRPIDPDSPLERLRREGKIREPEVYDRWLPDPVKLAPGPMVSDLIKDERR